MKLRVKELVIVLVVLGILNVLVQYSYQKGTKELEDIGNKYNAYVRHMTPRMYQKATDSYRLESPANSFMRKATLKVEKDYREIIAKHHNHSWESNSVYYQIGIITNSYTILKHRAEKGAFMTSY